LDDERFHRLHRQCGPRDEEGGSSEEETGIAFVATVSSKFHAPVQSTCMDFSNLEKERKKKKKKVFRNQN
jgi:hypothetical protein